MTADYSDIIAGVLSVLKADANLTGSSGLLRLKISARACTSIGSPSGVPVP